MGGIFISYRREDSAPYARLLSESLGAHFGPDQIFRDIDTLGPGVDFPEAIAKAVGSCDVLLAVIGDKWLTAEQEGRRRLDNPTDYVRLEIAAALERDVLVVPVLVEQTRMPSKGDLPAALAELADRNAVRLSDESWNDGIRRLATALEKALAADKPAAVPSPAPTPRPGPTPAWQPTPAAAPPPPPVPGTWAPAPRSPEPPPASGADAGRKRTGLIAGVAAAALVLVAVTVVIAVSGNEGSGGNSRVTVTVGPATTAGDSTRTTFGRITNPTFTLDPGIVRVETDLKVSPASGPVGTTVTVSGSGFAADERVDIRFSTTLVGQARADSKGAFSGLSFKIPDTPFRIQFEVVGTGAQSVRSASAPFKVT